MENRGDRLRTVLGKGMRTYLKGEIAGICRECPLRDSCELNRNGNSAGQMAVKLTRVGAGANRRNLRNVIQKFSDIFSSQIPCAVAFGGIKKVREFLANKSAGPAADPLPYYDSRMAAAGENIRSYHVD